MSFKIEKNVPMNESALPKYPFAEMAVGDSFRVELVDRTRVASASHMYSARQNPGVKFSTKKHDDAYRCWRVK